MPLPTISSITPIKSGQDWVRTFSIVCSWRTGFPVCLPEVAAQGKQLGKRSGKRGELFLQARGIVSDTPIEIGLLLPT
jgi:hypothetical protein